MPAIAAWIDRVIDHADDEAELGRIKQEVAEFCRAFPAPGIRI